MLRPMLCSRRSARPSAERIRQASAASAAARLDGGGQRLEQRDGRGRSGSDRAGSRLARSTSSGPGGTPKGMASVRSAPSASEASGGAAGVPPSKPGSPSGAVARSGVVPVARIRPARSERGRGGIGPRTRRWVQPPSGAAPSASSAAGRSFSADSQRAARPRRASGASSEPSGTRGPDLGRVLPPPHARQGRGRAGTGRDRPARGAPPPARPGARGASAYRSSSDSATARRYAAAGSRARASRATAVARSSRLVGGPSLGRGGARRERRRELGLADAGGLHLGGRWRDRRGAVPAAAETWNAPGVPGAGTVESASKRGADGAGGGGKRALRQSRPAGWARVAGPVKGPPVRAAGVGDAPWPPGEVPACVPRCHGTRTGDPHPARGSRAAS